VVRWEKQTKGNMMTNNERARPVALITGGSRGIGAATALRLAKQGYDVIIPYRNKAARAEAVVKEIEAEGGRGLAIASDITSPADRTALAKQVAVWTGGRLDALVLNASGGLERDLVAADPEYPMRINRDAQIETLNALLPLLQQAKGQAVVVFVTSHWAHLYGKVEQFPSYEPVASSKFAGEQALRARQDELSDAGVRLAIVTGDLIEGTITPKLLERAQPGLAESRRGQVGKLPTVEDMAEAIVRAVTATDMKTGETIVVGGALESLPAAGA
jgi:NAD(P)-dependent dehydrogenase (short-subunit alcohol dehydrogenase family)